MFTETDIIALAWLAEETVNQVLTEDKMKADRIFLVGSYAAGLQKEESDLDFVIQLKDLTHWNRTFPNARKIWWYLRAINQKLKNSRIHVTFGTEQATESLHQKHKNDPTRPYKYREIQLRRQINHVTDSHTVTA